MTVDQLDELIRKYLSTGVAMVLVLVGPAAAPSGAAASAGGNDERALHRRAAHQQPLPEPLRHRRAGSTGGSYDSRTKPTAEPDATRKPTADPRAKPTAEPDADPETTAGPAATPPPPPPPTAGAPPTARTTSPSDLSGWGVYDGPGHADKGTRSPAAASVADGVLTITGDAEGTTAGMAWGNGRPEVRPLGGPGPRARRRPHPTTPCCCSGPTPRTARRAARSTSWR